MGEQQEPDMSREVFDSRGSAAVAGCGGRCGVWGRLPWF